MTFPMRFRHVGFLTALVLIGALPAQGNDTIRAGGQNYRGPIIQMSPTQVVIEVQAVEQTIPVNQIESLMYANEPGGMQTARGHIANRAYENALAALERIDRDTVARREILQEIDYLTAYCRAQIALQGNADLREAGRHMNRFAQQNRGHYRFLEANEVIGDLLVAHGQHATAEKFYAELAKAPWADYQMRAGVALGRARLAQGNVDEAAQAFDTVLATKADGELAETQRRAARLGKAVCQALTGSPDEAIKAVEGILMKVDPEDIETHARAYNALGTAHRRAGRVQDALLAYLHVDTLYFQVGDAHAEALSHLAKLWNEVGRTEEAVRAQQILQEQYPNSPWTN